VLYNCGLSVCNKLLRTFLVTYLGVHIAGRDKFSFHFAHTKCRKRCFYAAFSLSLGKTSYTISGAASGDEVVLKIGTSEINIGLPLTSTVVNILDLLLMMR
jgi:hypothetical protein